MSRAKIPRKSTHIDMTAMCDVAFLLLSFFILATKQKPPEAVAVVTPSSVSTKAAPEKSIMITMTKEGKVFIMLGDDTKKSAILSDLNTTRNLGLSPTELSRLNKMTAYGMSLGQIKPMMDLGQDIPASKMDGIPVSDSTNNELTYWLASVTNAYKGTDQTKLEEMLLVKGDNLAKYPIFKSVKDAFKKNSLYKFRIVTNSESAPAGSELEKANRTNKNG